VRCKLKYKVRVVCESHLVTTTTALIYYGIKAIT
jgi:hypothetical protein